MEFSKQIARHLREVHFGGNWTDSCLKDHISDLTREEALMQVSNLNSIATLICHMNYYIHKVTRVLNGLPLDASDRLSFKIPDLNSDNAWEQLIQKIWDDADKLAVLIENLPDSKLSENLADEKYGSNYRNLQGIIEHFHYHLGQIVLIKKMIRKG